MRCTRSPGGPRWCTVDPETDECSLYQGPNGIYGGEEVVVYCLYYCLRHTYLL